MLSVQNNIAQVFLLKKKKKYVVVTNLVLVLINTKPKVFKNVVPIKFFFQIETLLIYVCLSSQATFFFVANN